MKSRSKRIIHPIIKLMIRTTASLYFEKVNIKGLENIPQEGPVILACNHPNSFLDALIITVYYKRPIFYIARGDAFKRPFGKKMLSFLNNVPIFRKEEGMKDNLSKNEETFSYCMDVLKEGDTILLFSEGLCENEWYLRPLRKGTGRLVYDAWNDPEIGGTLKVIPVTTNYSGWHGSGNSTFVELLKPIEKKSFTDTNEQGLFLRKFNTLLANCLSEKVISIDKSKEAEAQNTITGFLLKNFTNGDELAKKASLEFTNPDAKMFHKKYLELANYIKTENLTYFTNGNIVSFLVALFILPLAIILNIIPYSICKYIAWKTTRKNVFYDSVFFGSLLILGPIYMLELTLLSLHSTHSYYCFLLPIIAMLSAWSYESAKRHYYSFLQRKKLAKVSVLLNELFGKDND
jgi:1-acyl-sn-glycerol-3-phosphate acyltransferase